MKIKCLIIDDEPAAQRVVEKFLENVSYIELAGTCKTAFEAINFLKKNQVDLLFLDINMPGLSGIDFLKSHRDPPLAIITTAYREYAVESYELDVVDYLQKPFSFDRFYLALQKAEEKHYARARIPATGTMDGKEVKDHFFIRADKKFIKINFNDLVYVESMGDYCKIITDKKRVVANITLKKLEKTLPPDLFIRIHKSYIISIKRIELVEGNIVKIGDASIPIGYTYKKEFLKLVEED